MADISGWGVDEWGVSNWGGAAAASATYVVSGLEARTLCFGNAIQLLWNNPDTAVVRCKIVRRLRSWPWDTTDLHDVVYEGPMIAQDATLGMSSFVDTGVAYPIHYLAVGVAAGATSITVDDDTDIADGMLLLLENLTGERFSEVVEVSGAPVANVVSLASSLTRAWGSGIRVSQYRPLLDQTYYYYVVMVTNDPLYTDLSYTVDGNSRTMGLSIKAWDGKTWFWKHTPRVYWVEDERSAAEGGGAGFLNKWYQVMGCWLNLMKGTANAALTLGDDDKAPYHTLAAKSRSFGFEPEGFSYDFSVARATLMDLIALYKIKGTCPGIERLTKRLTGWDSLCVDLASNVCNSGPSTLKTWDGSSEVDYGEGQSPVVTSNGFTRQFQDTSKTGITGWDDGLWQGGQLFGAMGDVCCIDNNVGNIVTLREPITYQTTINANALLGATTIVVASSTGFKERMDFQITTGAATSIHEIETIAGSTWTIRPPLPFAVSIGHRISIEKTFIRAEITGSGTVVGQVLTDTNASWVDGAWLGYQLVDSAGNIWNITDSTLNTVTVDGGALVAGVYAISPAFTMSGGAAYANRVPTYRYRIINGEHSYILDPTMDIERKWTKYDQNYYLWQGPSSEIFGAWGPTDVGVYITSDVTYIQGIATTSTTNTLTLDPSQPAPLVNALVGMFLNPNQNQKELFEITANTPTTVTISGTIDGLVVPGQAYYVLRQRDARRFTRLSARLTDDFTDIDANPHVLFV